jgi:hypothetical protein
MARVRVRVHFRLRLVVRTEASVGCDGYGYGYDDDDADEDEEDDVQRASPETSYRREKLPASVRPVDQRAAGAVADQDDYDLCMDSHSVAVADVALQHYRDQD